MSEHDPKAPPAKPEIIGGMGAQESGHDTAHVSGYVGDPPAPGTVIELIPPTDARTAQRGRIRRQNLVALHEKAVLRREADLEAQRASKRSPEAFAGRRMPAQAREHPEVNIDYLPRVRRIFVRPANPKRAVLDLLGRPYPAAGLYVPAGDAYVHRRLRDGSLVRATPPP